MRAIPPAMQEIITEGDFTGDKKAVCRVTINNSPYLGIFEIPGIGKGPGQTYSSILFSTRRDNFRELPNVKSVSWDRSIDQEIATCTMELFNTVALPPGTGPDTGDSFDLLGYYTYNRGRTSYSQSTWGHKANEWRGQLIPDAMVRVYQGYGECDYSVYPENDPALIQTGVWLIDDITYTADGLITVEMRDLGRLLTDQTCFPPVIPLGHYPLAFEQKHFSKRPDVKKMVPSDEARYRYGPPTYDSSTNWTTGAVYGHHPIDAFDVVDPETKRPNETTYWLSEGNRTPDNFEWIQGKLDKVHLQEVHLMSWAGPYKVYVSIQVDGVWQGAQTIPYTPASASDDRKANIPFVAEGVVGKDAFTYFLADYENVTMVRYTFTDLYQSGMGVPHSYRAGLRFMIARWTEPGPMVEEVTEGQLVKVGNFQDFGEVVKRLLAYGGFYWPQDGEMHLSYTHGGNIPQNSVTYSFDRGDPFLSTESGDDRLERLVQEIKEGRTFDDIRRSVDIIATGTLDQHYEPLPTGPGQDAPHYPPPKGPATDAQVAARIQAIFDNRGVSLENPDGKGRVWGDIEMAGAPGASGRVTRIIEEIANGRTFDSIRRSVDFIKYKNWDQHYEPLPTAPGTDDAYLPPPYGTATDAQVRARIQAIFDNREVETGDSDYPVYLGVEVFDKKPLLDGIVHIRDMLGFVFYIDEHGAAQFRHPNMFKLGNWLNEANGPGLSRTRDYITLRDDEAILGLRSKLSSRNLREHVFVADVTGKTGALSKSRFPIPSSFRRVYGWTDQHFEGEEGMKQAQIMADMITLRQLFTFRQNSLRIPANPAIQCDDQIEIMERTTGEAYMHYVRAISSTWDLASGQWAFDLTTSWLGEDPEGEWAFETETLDPITKDYLAAIGQHANTDEGAAEPPPPPPPQG